MRSTALRLIAGLLSVLVGATPSWGQLSGALTPAHGLRIAQNGAPSTSIPPMVPLNSGSPLGFDPYAPSTGAFSGLRPQSGAALAVPASTVPPSLPNTSYAPQVLPGYTPSVPYPTGTPLGGIGPGTYPSYTGPPPPLPGAGQSAIINTNPALAPGAISGPGMYPNSTPSALFPGAYNYGSGSGGLFQNWFGGSSNNGFGGGTYGAPAYNPGYPGGWLPGQSGGWGGTNWNPSGSMFNGQLGQPPTFIRLFQGPRFRHTYIHGDKKHNDLAINDTDVSLAFAIPNFLFSTQPVYLLPSFSLHLWDGPRSYLNPANTADLPSNAFSAFLDVGWQSDPARIFGAELGTRVGIFSDFDAISTRSLRILGRGIGRVRLTPQSTLKLGILYLDRNRVKLLPAGGFLWQPNPGTRLDIFFPEPKLSSYMTTLGNTDTWWYVAAYYGGGNWTVRRDDSTKDAVDINDVRIVFGLEWGRNEMMRDGRRVGFAEAGYAFSRELLYKDRPADNLDLRDNFVVRIGFGY
ncbi:MAG: hypothetical protein KF752_07735 [Pirellulaceae bacterium]|nr:hypothetical protein [Pirellulaceae bacterium]